MGAHYVPPPNSNDPEDKAWHAGYDVGYRDGENSVAADQQFTREEIIEPLEAQVAALTASVEALTQENLELRGRQEALDRSSEVALWTTLEDLRVHAYAADCTPAENFGFLLGEVERLLCQLAAAEAEREALITQRDALQKELDESSVEWNRALCEEVNGYAELAAALGEPILESGDGDARHARLLSKIRAREALITAVGQIAREMRATVSWDDIGELTERLAAIVERPADRS